MELARQVTRLVLEQRSHRATEKELDDAVEEVVECVSSLGECSVRCVLGHAACGRRCAAASTVEVWTVRVVPSGETSEPGLDGVFLRQAVRSHLHFSQLASWMHKQQLDGEEEEDEEREYVVRYRLSRNPSLCASPPSVVDESDEHQHPRRHAFPLSRAVDGVRLAVSVEYLSVDGIERPARCDRGSDEWPSSQLRDSPVSSPDAAPPPPPPVVPLLRLQLPRLPPPTTLCLPASAEHRNGKKHKWRQADGELVSPDSCARAAKLPALEREEQEEERVPDATDGIAEMRIEEEEEEERRSRQPRRVLNLGGGGGYVMPALPGFNRKTGLPTHSSPAPLARRKRGEAEEGRGRRLFAPAAPLLGSFEESALNGRLSPAATLDGYSMQISAAGVFCSPHRVLPVQTVVFGREEEGGGEENAEAPVASMGVCNLSVLESKKGYRIPQKGTVQATLFNPEGTAVHVFLVGYDVSDMPPRSRTFLRQRTVLTRAGGCGGKGGKWLRYLIHLRVASDSHRRIFLHSDVRVLVGQNRTLDAMGLVEGEVPLREVREVQVPERPRYSPR